MVVSILFFVLAAALISLGIAGSIRFWNKGLIALFFFFATLLIISAGHAMAGIDLCNMRYTAIDMNLLALIDIGGCVILSLCVLGGIAFCSILALFVTSIGQAIGG